MRIPIQFQDESLSGFSRSIRGSNSFGRFCPHRVGESGLKVLSKLQDHRPTRLCLRRNLALPPIYIHSTLIPRNLTLIYQEFLGLYSDISPRIGNFFVLIMLHICVDIELLFNY